jgi:hypothetical protein
LAEKLHKFVWEIDTGMTCEEFNDWYHWSELKEEEEAKERKKQAAKSRKGR